jgi:outer membrane protein assembly factor BamA
MGRISSLIIFIVCLSLGGVAFSADQVSDEYEGLPVEKISFEGNDVVKDQELCQQLMIQEGDAFNELNLNVSRESLEDLGKFDSVETEVVREGEGVAITFTVDESWYVLSRPRFGKKKEEPDIVCRWPAEDEIDRSLDGLIIKSISFEGNKITREIIFREEILFTEGDVFEVDKMESSRQYIQNLGIFKVVEARAVREGDGVAVIFKVEEKWYILPIPRLGLNGDADINYGAELRWDNAFGLNQQFKVIAEQIDRGSGQRDQVTSLQYSIPKIPGTPYGVSSAIQRNSTLKESKDDIGQSLGEYNDITDNFSVNVSRWLKRIAPSKGWRGNVAMNWIRIHEQQVSGTPELSAENRELRLGTGVDFTDVDDFEYRRQGNAYGAAVRFGRESLGSDVNFYTVEGFWRSYNTIRKPRYSNLNFQLRSGYNNGKTNAFSLGSNSTIRGVVDSVQGDVYTLLNVNWLVPLPRHQSFRGVLFTDIGNAWPRDDIQLDKWVVTFGVGFRWKIRSLVDTALRADFAYNPATGEYKAYGGTNYMF